MRICLVQKRMCNSLFVPCLTVETMMYMIHILYNVRKRLCLSSGMPKCRNALSIVIEVLVKHNLNVVKYCV